jgi:hypothetical protein
MTLLFPRKSILMTVAVLKSPLAALLLNLTAGSGVHTADG